MSDLLFLAHRVPYPPNKGDKIRSYHLLRHLSTRYRVHLGAFVDDPSDWDHAGELRRICDDIHLVPLARHRAKVWSLTGFMTGEPLTLPYFRSANLQAWVDSVVATRRIRRIFVFSSAMAQYVARHLTPGTRRVLDFVDVDSDKWRQYAKARGWPLSAIYDREARTLGRYECAIAADFDANVFVSSAEAALFRSLAPEHAGRTLHISNGVDREYFSPSRPYSSPYRTGELPIVFTGALDYWANVDGVRWFARTVFPQIATRFGAARFCIVGGRPTPGVRALATEPGIEVVGRVDDIRPWLAHAKLVVAPLRVARGVQNKVLEAMAMEKPIAATLAAVQGLEPGHGLYATPSDAPAQMAERIAKLLLRGEPPEALAHRRRYVAQHYDWQSSLERIELLLDGRTRNASDPVWAGDDHPAMAEERPYSVAGASEAETTVRAAAADLGPRHD
jgi:sugar transferase (PEP-CTERM/EpsH1 system associated)